MRDLTQLDQYRITTPRVVALFGDIGGSADGAFAIPSPIDRQPLMVIASTGYGWDHVSVSRNNRTPNWPEMEKVRKLCFAAHEVVMQLVSPLPAHVAAT